VRVLLAGTGVQAIPPTGYGGVERTIAEYAEALRTAGHEAVIVNEVRGGRMRDEYPFARSLPRLLQDQRYDVLHASTPVVANRLAGLGLPFVYTTHSRHWFDREGLTQRWGYYLERRAVRRASATIALTARLAETIVTSVGSEVRDRLRVIPIGVDTERFQPAASERTGSVALGVGVVAPVKRWELAATGLRGSGFRFRLVGPITDPQYAAAVRAAGDQVEIVGELGDDELRREYARADLLVHPSRVEILPGVVLQAMASGLPVLGTEVISSIIEPTITGWCSPPGADAEQIVTFIRDRATALREYPELARTAGQRGRELALERYQWSEVVRRHLEVYRAVIEGSVSRSGTPAG
jgi:glycosyltransferase involved in cell wall biosynthesis